MQRLEHICHSFLWNGSSDSARGTKISWESVCSPKKAGSLGLRRLLGTNQVYGLKLIWCLKLFAGEGSLWVALIKNMVIRDRLFWRADFHASGSWIWRRLMKLRPLARPSLYCTVHLGNEALFWHDNWTSLGPLIDITGPNGPMVSGIPLLANVAAACIDGSWNLPRGRHPLLLLIRQCLPLPTPYLDPSLTDFFLWQNGLNESPGNFSTSKSWNSLHPSSSTVDWHKYVWFKGRIPKHAFHMWVTVRDRLPMRDHLRSWGLNVPSGCLLCADGEENINTLCFSALSPTRFGPPFLVIMI